MTFLFLLFYSGQGKGRQMNKVISVCPYCGAICKLNLCVENGKIIKAEGADMGGTNRGRLCV